MAQQLTIVGGGLVGASLACALRPLRIGITILEEAPLESDSQPSFDERTIALTFGSRRVLEAIGVWQAIEAEAGPIHRIHVSNRGHAGFTRLDREHIGTEALGYVVPTRALGRILVDELTKNPLIDYRCPIRATGIAASADTSAVSVQTESAIVESSLVVLADGGRSPLADQLGMIRRETPFAEHALVGIVGVDRSHQGTAYERFTPHGPLALLPLRDNRFALAWTLPETRARSLAYCEAKAFLSELQEAFGDRVGYFTRCDRRTVYPLKRADLMTPVAERCVAIGNAAHILHPVAGQGFNLGLRDVAHLAEVLASAVAEEKDIGSAECLAQYARARKTQTQRVTRFTHGLLQIFANELPGLRLARNIGLNAIEIFPPAKRFLLKRTVGLAGTLPRLSRGMSLPPHP